MHNDWTYLIIEIFFPAKCGFSERNTFKDVSAPLGVKSCIEDEFLAYWQGKRHYTGMCVKNRISELRFFGADA